MHSYYPLTMGRAVIVVVAALALAGCSQEKPAAQPDWTYSPPAYTEPTTRAPAAQLPVAPPAGVIGTPVQDGQLQFVVNGVTRASEVVHPGAGTLTQEATGEYVIVDMTVTNIGAAPVQFYSDAQQLVIDGRQHSVDLTAALYASPGAQDLIQPGLSMDVLVPFDVPVGSAPEAVMLMDFEDANPMSVRVNL